MNKITSFTVDHRNIVPGIYISRVDGDITTFDMRFKKPNTGDLLSDSELHSLEHMFATFIRNSEIKDLVIYFGPMGCQTGFYLLVRDVDLDCIVEDIKIALKQVIDYNGAVFGDSEIECGNCRNLNLEAAKRAAKQYLHVLENNINDFKYCL